ncbi:thymidine phosphorylase [Lacibacterium aquatile]|uniref:Thymidine phosphorylase n=1 Tax=Lacibacterium aquatile TaxID=1168082 RepID=A0ABW5DSK9_9PROT
MTYLPQELIRKKRDGGALTPDELRFLVKGLTDGSLADEQVGAFAMAVYFQGMAMPERIAFTAAMRDSGDVLNWQQFDLDAPVVDKHSTGGVGDKVSLMLAPIVAACGGAVPMISGRGLGHTGGTLDKFDSIPGYNTAPSPDLFVKVTKEVGCAIIGQTAKMAPADKRLYGIRDVTATVESIPLITASILSKKLAAGLDALVMDVKFGSGSFMGPLDRSRELADSIVKVATGAGVPTRALLTDMNEVLGWTAGNAVEMREAVEYLTGTKREKRLHEVTKALAVAMLRVTSLFDSDEAAAQAVEDSLSSGKATEKFAQMVTALGGPADFVQNYDKHLGKAPIVKAITASKTGFVSAIDTRAVGLAVVAMGGGRTRSADAIDHAVGLTDIAGLGAEVGPNRPLAIVHARDEAQVQRVQMMLDAAFTVGAAAPAPGPVVAEVLGA